MTFEDAVQVFGHGFAACKSLFGPCIFEDVDGLGVLRDGPGRKGPPRLVEVVAYGRPLVNVMATYHDLPFDRKFLCVFVDDLETTVEQVRAYKSAGMSLMVKEPFFVATPGQATSGSNPNVRRVDSWDGAVMVNKAAGRSQILKCQIEDDSSNRLYAAWEGGRPIGWVRSVRATTSGNWVSNLYVDAEFRRRGLGSDLMRAMLAEDRKYGVANSVLLSSHVGAMLYPTVGYRLIGQLLLFRPNKRLRDP